MIREDSLDINASILHIANLYYSIRGMSKPNSLVDDAEKALFIVTLPI